MGGFAPVEGGTGGMSGTIGGIGTILGLMGNLSAAGASRDQGSAQKAALNYEAAQLDQAAGQSIASSQRAAIDERRRAALVVSRGLAVAAASGGGASDPTVTHLLTDITGEGAYRASVALYQGEEKARQLRMGASAKRYEGDVMEQGGQDKGLAYTFAGFGQAATGIASLYGKYGEGGPKGAGSSGSWFDAGTSGFPSVG